MSTNETESPILDRKYTPEDLKDGAAGLGEALDIALERHAGDIQYVPGSDGQDIYRLTLYGSDPRISVVAEVTHSDPRTSKVVWEDVRFYYSQTEGRRRYSLDRRDPEEPQILINGKPLSRPDSLDDQNLVAIEGLLLEGSPVKPESNRKPKLQAAIALGRGALRRVLKRS